MIDRLLADLEESINPDIENELMDDWIGFYDGRVEKGVFCPRRKECSHPKQAWPKVTVNAAIQNPEAMIIQQYGDCIQSLLHGDGRILNVRCNYGTGILPVLFGAELFMMDESLDTLPTVKPLVNIDLVKKTIDAGIPSLETSIAGKVFDMAEIFIGIGQKYPKIGRYVHIYHPDTQGPFDVCELIIGSSIFYMLYDQPDLIKDLLNLVTKTYIAYMNKWFALVPRKSQYSAHWGMLQRGSVMLRDDSATNLSMEMYDEFIKPYDQIILNEFDGGAIHFCGRGDHFIPSMSRMSLLYAIAMSQPELNNMERIYQNTIDKDIRLIGFSRYYAELALSAGRDLRGRVQCF